MTEPKIIITTNKTPFNIFQIYADTWKYRSFLLNLTNRELEMRYKGSFLGILWNFLNPLLSLAIYFFVFSRITQTAIPNYLVFLFIGINAWNFSIQVLGRACDLFPSNAGFLSKVYFPQEILIISLIASGAINYLISFSLILILMLITKASITLNLLWFPFLVVLHSIFLYATCLFLSSVGAIIRDLSYIVNTLLSLLFFLTPIIYSAETISKKYAWILNAQPFASIISLYRDIVHAGHHPNWHLLLYFCLFTLIWYLISHWIFNRLRYIVSDLI